MVKDCKVILNNDYVTVIDFDGSCVQIPSIGRKAKTVKVVKDQGIYTVVDDNYIEEKPKAPIKEAQKKKANKKTTENNEQKDAPNVSENLD